MPTLDAAAQQAASCHPDHDMLSYGICTEAHRCKKNMNNKGDPARASNKVLCHLIRTRRNSKDRTWPMPKCNIHQHSGSEHNYAVPVPHVLFLFWWAAARGFDVFQIEEPYGSCRPQKVSCSFRSHPQVRYCQVSAPMCSLSKLLVPRNVSQRWRVANNGGDIKRPRGPWNRQSRADLGPGWPMALGLLIHG